MLFKKKFHNFSFSYIKGDKVRTAKITKQHKSLEVSKTWLHSMKKRESTYPCSSGAHSLPPCPNLLSPGSCLPARRLRLSCILDMKKGDVVRDPCTQLHPRPAFLWPLQAQLKALVCICFPICRSTTFGSPRF